MQGLQAVQSNGGSSGVHMRMKYVKSKLDPDSNEWLLPSALSLKSFATTDGDRVDSLLPNARGPHKTSLPEDHHALEGLAVVNGGPRDPDFKEERVSRTKRISLGGLTRGKRTAGTARFSGRAHISGGHLQSGLHSLLLRLCM